MSKNLMFNRFSQTFHLSHNPFACIKRNEKVGFFGRPLSWHLQSTLLLFRAR
ncbi:hypothetical protein [Enterobacter phage 03_vB_Eclo_IJM]|nr:hypothetical protein [Enterobacter phage 03_vB_Eclo_IJM]